MADDRRVITGVHVVAREGNDLESGTKYVMDSTVGKYLGGKSSVDVDEDQWHATGWFVADYAVTRSEVGGASSLTVLSAAPSPLKFLYIKNRELTGGSLFVSLSVENVWNAGWQSSNNWNDSTYTDRAPAYDGLWDEGATIEIAPGASIILRGDGTNLTLAKVGLRPAVGTAQINIDYVIMQ